MALLFHANIIWQHAGETYFSPALKCPLKDSSVQRRSRLKAPHFSRSTAEISTNPVAFLYKRQRRQNASAPHSFPHFIPKFGPKIKKATVETCYLLYNICHLSTKMENKGTQLAHGRKELVSKLTVMCLDCTSDELDNYPPVSLRASGCLICSFSGCNNCRFLCVMLNTHLINSLWTNCFSSSRYPGQSLWTCL